MTTDTDARELTLFAENDGDLYRSRILPIIANLARKVAAGTFDADKALTLWRYAADDAAQRYTREHGTPGPHGSYGSFDTATRKACAAMLAESYAEHIADEAQVTPRRFRVFRRTWWANKACTIPRSGRKFHVCYVATEAEARAKCDTLGRMRYGTTKRGPRGAAYEYEARA